MHATLYTRRACCLCEVARTTLIEHGLNVREVDIDADPALCERFTSCVPVVEIDGRVRFRGRVDPLLLRRLLSHLSSDASMSAESSTDESS